MRTGGGEGVSCEDIWENNILDRGNSQCHGPRWNYAFWSEQQSGQCGQNAVVRVGSNRRSNRSANRSANYLGLYGLY